MKIEFLGLAEKQATVCILRALVAGPAVAHNVASHPGRDPSALKVRREIVRDATGPYTSGEYTTSEFLGLGEAIKAGGVG